MTQRWRASSPADLRWVEWEGGGAVYHRPSGKTHFANAATVLILRELLVAPEDASAVAEALRDAGATMPGDASLLTHVEELLARLDELGLVHRVES